MADTPEPPGTDSEVLEETTTTVAPPPMYRVILVNDDYTPREFVVYILVAIFQIGRPKAQRIMLGAHQGGKSIVGVYTYDVATTRTDRAKREANEAGYPLQMYVEEV